MQVGEQILKLLIGEGVAKCGHQVTSTENDCSDALVVCGCSARQVFLFVESLKPGPVERAVGVGVVAPGAARDVDLVSGSFLRGELAKGF